MGVKSETDNQIVLGTKDQEVYIPGDLRIGGNIVLNDLEVENLHVKKCFWLRVVQCWGMTVLQEFM